jgi:hypothetical protein
MCDENNISEELKAVEKALGVLRPRRCPLEQQWSDLLAEKAAIAETFAAQEGGRFSTEKQSPFSVPRSVNRFPRLMGRLLPVGVFSQQVSVLLVCVATLIAWYCSTIDYPRGRQSDLKAAASGASFNFLPTVVARVTGAVDCRWADGVPAPAYLGDLIIGQWLRLESGLLEITYSSGAKIVLQGPATYEVCSDGGYLASGKLVGKLADVFSVGQRKNKNVELGRLITPAEVRAAPVHFLVRAPLVDVFDLGTEFGIKVDGTDGSTQVHIFDGFVALCSPIAVGQRSNFVLQEREAACFSPTQDGQECVMRYISVAPGEFSRRADVTNRVDAVSVPPGDATTKP